MSTLDTDPAAVSRHSIALAHMVVKAELPDDWVARCVRG